LRGLKIPKSAGKKGFKGVISLIKAFQPTWAKEELDALVVKLSGLKQDVECRIVVDLR
jgi:hypothetical protein